MKGHPWIRKTGDFLQGAAAMAAYGLFRLLPLDWASWLGGWIARTIGPHLRPSETARDNLAMALPELSVAERERILNGVWDNLGRVAGEFPHVARFAIDGPGARIEVVGAEHVENLRDDGKPGLFVSGHLGNWEITPHASDHYRLPFALIYRSANNPWVEALFRRARGASRGEMLTKGNAGAKRALELLRGGGHLAMLVDQKMNDGIAVPFFGRDAMTAPALAQFAYRYECPVVPARVIRLKGAHFRVEVLPPMFLERTGDRQADILAFMTRINALLEGWIREHPDQWLWLHRRWPRDRASGN
jgi:KDO2-lipid IV(A) lauroyltransferase